jgi:predicted nucleic acid-binding protein
MAMQSKKVYLTPSGFIAFVDRAHPKHEHAAAFFRYFGLEKYTLYTDIVAITNTYNRIYSSISPSLAKDYLRTIFLGDINIIYPEENEIKAALKTLVNYQSTELTFDMALMSVLANRRGISQIFTFDYLHQLFGQTTFYLPM